MIKNVLLLFGTLVLFIINTIVIVDLKITPNSPSEVEPGAEFTFEINIAKGEVSGFAKIQQQLPAGFTAEAVETKGASFTFSDGRVKFIWMSLPAEEEFTISYKVKVGDNVSGDFQVGGKFSYLENNERKSVEIPNQQITVKAPETAEVTEPEEQPEETQSAETEPEVPAVTEPEETPTSSETSSSTEAATQAESGCTRAIADNGDGTYNVDVTIAIPGVSGFAKAQDILPAPLKADQGEVAGAVFSFVSQKAKFVWMSVPGGPETKISYVVDLNGGSPDLLNNITGMFQYLKDNQTQKVPITTISAPELAQTTEPATTTEPTTTETTEPATTTEPTTTTEPADQATAAAAEEERKRQEEAARKAEEERKRQEADRKRKEEEARKAEEERKRKEAATATTTPTPKSGVDYRVQICANHKNLNDISRTFRNEFQYDQNSESRIDIDNHEGWIKYLIDHYSGYRGARDRRNDVTGKYPTLPGPFVTAYNNGSRITVQEALMITKQKWMQ